MEVFNCTYWHFNISRTDKTFLDKLLAARSAQHSGRTVPFSMCLKHSIIFRKLKEAIIRQKQINVDKLFFIYIVLSSTNFSSGV